MKRYNEEEAIKAIKNTDNKSVRAILKEIGMCEIAGGNYQLIYETVKKFNLDTSHWLGQAIRKGQVFGNKRPISDYLENKAFIKSHALKLRLIKEGIKLERCERCNNSTWLGEKIPLELHHIDGNNRNHNLNNIQILCPNCHALTPNFCSKNSKTNSYNRVILSDQEIAELIKNCCSFAEIFNKLNISSSMASYEKIRAIKNKYGVDFLPQPKILKVKKNSNWRHDPRCHKRKVVRPSKEELIELIKRKSMCQIAKDFGLKNDNSIRKWCESYEINYIEISPFSLKYKKANPKPIQPKKINRIFAENEILEILRLIREEKISLREIAKLFNTNHQMIMKIRDRNLNGPLDQQQGVVPLRTETVSVEI